MEDSEENMHVVIGTERVKAKVKSLLSKFEPSNHKINMELHF